MSHSGTKIRPGIPTNWRIFESIDSIFDSNILQLLSISWRIIVPPVTLLFRSNWLHFFFQCYRSSISSEVSHHATLSASPLWHQITGHYCGSLLRVIIQFYNKENKNKEAFGRQFNTVASTFSLTLFLLACHIWHHLAPNLRRDRQKNFLWASRLWVGRRKEPVLGDVPKNYEKKNLFHKGLICCIN